MTAAQGTPADGLRAAVLDDYQSVALAAADWTSLDGKVSVEVFHDHLADEGELAARLAPFDIVVAMRERTPFPRTLLERLPQLRLLVTTGPFNAVVDLGAAAQHGVTVCGTGSFVPPTAELTWALILACTKQIPANDRAVREGDWQRTLSADLHGATLGVVGLGRFGSLVATIGQAFGMDVVAWSQNLTPQRCEQVGVRPVTKEQLFARSDVVTVHLVLSARTLGLIGREDLRRMRPGAFLINTSRGPIVDEQALEIALREGWIAGAGLDVFDVEPLPHDHAFRHLDNVVVTPHIGYVSRRSYEVFYGDAVEDIEAFLEGTVLRPVVARQDWKP